MTSHQYHHHHECGRLFLPYLHQIQSVPVMTSPNDYLYFLYQINSHYQLCVQPHLSHHQLEHPYYPDTTNYHDQSMMMVPNYVQDDDDEYQVGGPASDPNTFSGDLSERKEEPSESIPPPIIIPKTKITKKLVIDQEIRTLRDLLNIIDTYPYSPDTETNIDLKALHHIQHELREINDMVGLNSLKDSLLDQLLYFVQGLHLNREQDFKHLVIYGPPGSGKTQTAKLIGQMYANLGILKNKTFRKVTRNDLVAGYLGQTAIKTNKVIQESLGGCLFIDEVYSLGCGGGGSAGDGGGGGGGECIDSYSKECVDTLCEALSNHKDDLMVIVAGYEKDVKESFFGMNPGLASRFIWRFTVEEYSPEELMRIFVQKVQQNEWQMMLEESDAAREFGGLLKWFESHKTDFVYFGRDMELLFTYTKIAHSRRIYGKGLECRKKLTMADLNQGYALFLKNSDDRSSGSKNRGGLSESCFGLYL
jgi:hypothetical protein